MASETLRPDAAGDECNIPDESGCSACPNHYDCVYEAVADDASTRVRNEQETPAWARDLYNIADHSVGSGTINHITVYACCFTATPGDHLKIVIKSGTGSGAPDTVDETAVIALISSWETKSNQWNTNPATSSPWTWDEIDKLQAGINLYTVEWSGTSCTQLYVVVDYTEAVAGRSFGFIIG